MCLTLLLCYSKLHFKIPFITLEAEPGFGCWLCHKPFTSLSAGMKPELFRHGSFWSLAFCLGPKKCWQKTRNKFSSLVAGTSTHWFDPFWDFHNNQLILEKGKYDHISTSTHNACEYKEEPEWLSYRVTV